MSRIILIAKVTDACNMRCKYCYNGETGYTNKKLSHEDFKKIMSILARSYDEIVVIWHGGEPLTVGLDYYEKAVKIEEEVTFAYGTRLENHIQTNGTLINDAWVKFFKKHDFKVGMSFDGIHNDTYRGRTNETLAAMELLKKNNIRFGTIAVVVDGDYNLVENYKFFAERKVPIEFSYMVSEGSGRNLAKLSAEQYAAATVELFDHWLYDKNGVGIRTFLSYILMALGGPAKICNNASCHGKYLSITATGDLYNCSRHSIQEYPFGNIAEVNEAGDIWASEGFKSLIKGSIERRKVCASTCEYFELCKGGCADVACSEGSLTVPPEYSCICFKTLFPHIQAAIKKIFEEKVPLSELNPSIRESVAKCFGVTEESSLTFIPERITLK